MKSMLSLLVLALFLTSCGSTQKIDKKALAKVKKVAVIVYSVPQKIDFRDDPTKENEVSLLGMIAKAFTVGEGSKAATLSQKAFIHAVNKNKNSPFKIANCKEVRENKAFAKLVKDINDKAAKAAVAAPKKKEGGMMGWMKKANSMMGSSSAKNLSSAPVGLASFGLATQWGEGNATTGKDGESDYIKKALDVLGVDGVLLINDLGYSFSCKACIGGTGAASTGSAFHASIITKGGKSILDVNQWFGTTSFSTGVVSGIVNPLSQDKMFVAHGEKMAEEFIEQVVETLEK